MFVQWLREGLLYALVLSVMIIVSQLIHARLWLSGYPKAIQDAVPPLSRKEKLARKLAGIPFMIVLMGYPVFSSFVFRAAAGDAFTLWLGFAHAMVIVSVFIVFDLLIIDWLIFCLITPRYIVLNGTKGMSAYKDYAFHAKVALKNFGISVFFCALLAGLLSVR